jgi:serine/threonine-protein kinase RsbW
LVVGDPERESSSDRPGSERFRLVVATDLMRIGDVVETVASCSLARRGASRQTYFRLRTILAEAIANAMVYGNRGEVSRLVTIEVELHADRMVIAVTDEGTGFNPDLIPTPTVDDRLDATRGRGLFLIRRLADHVAFNDRGNTIWMTLPRS